MQIDQFDTPSIQWNQLREQFVLQMLVSEVDEDYWVKLVSYCLDNLAYKVYEHWSGMVTRDQNIDWYEFSELMECHFQKKRELGLAQMELRSSQ